MLRNQFAINTPKVKLNPWHKVDETIANSIREEWAFYLRVLKAVMKNGMWRKRMIKHLQEILIDLENQYRRARGFK